MDATHAGHYLIRQTVLASALFIACSAAATAQPSPRFGIALSGGGARGLAHVGALQVLEDAGLAPDLVTGISMGAVIGGLYASGLSPDSIATLARDTDWGPLLTGSGGPDRSVRPRDDPEMLVEVPMSGLRVALPSGLATGQQAAAYLAALTWPVRTTEDFRELPVPFAAVAADLGTGEAVRLDHGNLAQAMRASLAIPMVFVPVEMDGRVLVDGGLARTVPAEDARHLGADVLACIDVSTPIRAPDSLRGVADVFGQSVGLLIAQADSLQRTLCDVVVVPDLGDLALSSFGEVDTLIAAGASAMREVLPRLRSLLPGRTPPRRAGPASPAAARIAAVRIEDEDGRLPERWIRASAGVDLASGEAVELDAAGVDASVARLFGTGSFETVLYDLRPGTDGDTLVLMVRERPRGRAGAALRFDTENRAAAIVRLRYSHLVVPGSALHFRLRAGQEMGTAVRFDLPLGYASPHALVVEAAGAEAYRPAAVPLDADPADSLATLPFTTTAAWVQAGVSSRLLGPLTVEVRGRAETFLTELDRSGMAGDGASFIGASVAAWYDRLDRSSWPRRGVTAQARGLAAAGLGSQDGFRHGAGSIDAFVPITPGLTALLAVAGGAAGGDVPPHMVFRAGGIGLEAPQWVLLDFPGHASRSLSARRIAVGSAGLRWEFAAGRFLTGRAAAGGSTGADDLSAGFAVGLGADTVVGPLELTLMGPGDMSPVRFQFALGHRF